MVLFFSSAALDEEKFQNETSYVSTRSTRRQFFLSYSDLKLSSLRIQFQELFTANVSEIKPVGITAMKFKEGEFSDDFTAVAVVVA